MNEPFLFFFPFFFLFFGGFSHLERKKINETKDETKPNEESKENQSIKNQIEIKIKIKVEADVRPATGRPSKTRTASPAWIDLIFDGHHF